MPLPWVRLDTSFGDHPKLLALLGAHKDGRATAFVYLMGLSYAGKHETDGFIPTSALGIIHGRSTDASRLVEGGLWEAVPGGWEVHGWSEFQISNAETQDRRKRARAAAEVRWAKEKRTRR